MLNAEIISVGTELLLGDVTDTNTQFISRQMAVLGIGVYYQSSVGDNGKRLRRLLAEAVS
ncbi:MAG: competence/damage-inducible protein A, partial [Oscillospiraceae bacterium]|nr:competence/damage-inducible protein A [Oscillospiraceae bacterium]